MAQFNFPTFTISFQNPYPTLARGEWIEETHSSREKAEKMAAFYRSCGVAVKKEILVR